MTRRRGWQDDSKEILHMILHIVDINVDVSRCSIGEQTNGKEKFRYARTWKAKISITTSLGRFLRTKGLRTWKTPI